MPKVRIVCPLCLGAGSTWTIDRSTRTKVRRKKCKQCKGNRYVWVEKRI